MIEPPILYSFRRCPYAIRARMALLISEVPFNLREVRLRDKPADLIAVSPKATVPVLVLATGEVIDESLDIMRWALRRHDPEGWLAGDDRGLIETFDGAFKHHLDRYKYPDRFGPPAPDHRDACLDLLLLLENRLALSTNLCGARRALTDIAIMPFVRQFAGVDPGWFGQQPLPRLQAWLSDHRESPLFYRAMLRPEPWSPAASAFSCDRPSST
ncbi:MAG: glutathione S-transferase [Sphingomonas sp. 28-66-16]|nr:MAG: glutathione S-transferase [Sphingomonas sp. 28-66-16]